MEEDSKMGLIKFGIGMSLLMFIMYRRFESVYFFYSGILLLFISMIFPLIFYPFYYLVKKVFLIIGKSISFVVLFLIFYFILTPLSFFYRLFSRDSLLCKKKILTSWKERDHLYTKYDLEDMF